MNKGESLSLDGRLDRSSVAVLASGTKHDSMDALRMASETSYFRGENALWVKLVVPEDPIEPIRPSNRQASITISR
jgi:cell migration-inducing and hyaluronan-binding protein